MTINFTDFQLENIVPKTAFELEVVDFLNDWFSPKDKVTVQSSGSTGKPKIFEIEKERMRASARMTCEFLGLKYGDKALICLPTAYISGKMMLVRAIEWKLKLIIETPSTDPLKNLGESVDFCAMTPLQVENSLDKIHLIKKLIIGGAAVSEALKRKIYLSLGDKLSVNDARQNTIFETYGMSETLSHIALKQIYPDAENYFKAFEGVEISADERGCLQIFAPKLNPEVLQTNDLVEIKNDIEFRFLGRIDNVVNSGGAKIFPEELEALLKKDIENELVFIGAPDEVLGEKLILIIEGTATDAINQKLATVNYPKSFHKPKEIIFIKEIPRLPNGKIDRMSLKNAGGWMREFGLKKSM